MIDKIYLDYETNGLTAYHPDFDVRLSGYMEPHGKVYQSENHIFPESSEIVGWSNYEYFVAKRTNYPLQKYTDLKIPFVLFNENSQWGLGKALRHIGKLDHKFLKIQWERLGYKWNNVPYQYLKPYNKLDVLAMDWLNDWIQDKYSTKQNNLLQTVNQILCEMCWQGIKVDLKENKKQYRYYKKLTDTQEKQLLEKADINWNSPEQVGNYLKKKEKVKLPKTPSGKGYSANKEVLKQFRDNKTIDLYLEWNRNRTLLDTFVVGLHDKVQYDGKLHPSFSFAKTGRYRFSQPNMQNLPKIDKAPMRRQIIPETEDSVLYGVDWDQLEICLIAVAFNIKKLINEINRGIDVHQRSADQFNIKRHDAKQCNFGTFYGAGKYALRKHNLEPDDAQQFINYIHSEYLDLRSIHHRNSEAADKGEITNLFDRTRRSYKFTEINNFLIQSIAGDLNKMVLIRAWTLSKELGFKSRPYFDIHDELIFTVVKKEEKEYLDKVIKVSYNKIKEDIYKWFQVDFPLNLQYSIKTGKNYGDLKEIK